MNDISAKLVKELRDVTGAGMMDCKKALIECDCNIESAIVKLRQKGLASADKKNARATTEGLIESYIHIGSKIGVLVEINCETDFVARRSEFQQLAKNIAMQIASSSNITFVSIKDIPEVIVNTEKEIELGKQDLLNKPEEIKEKIISGRIEKRLKEMCLLDQPFIKNSDITIDELIKENISLLGENIQVRRFQKFVLGEGV
uniref:Multifunctional fusion protein n=1 Tax=Corynoplastis japonica TaxID=700918 RepID=A0A1X9PTS8_9RHOD|nr:translation elongation factor Ts [Corynoplastis japonica]